MVSNKRFESGGFLKVQFAISLRDTDYIILSNKTKSLPNHVIVSIIEEVARCPRFKFNNVCNFNCELLLFELSILTLALVSAFHSQIQKLLALNIMSLSNVSANSKTSEYLGGLFQV